MPLSLINLAVPNGDTPRSANTKINNMMAELYAGKADNSYLSSKGLGTFSPATDADTNFKDPGSMQSFIRSNWGGGTVEGTGPYPAHFNVLSMGSDTRKSIVVMQAYNTGLVPWPRMWIRSRHDDNFSPEAEVYTTRNTTRAADGTLKAI